MVSGPSVNLHHLIPRTYKGTDTVALHRICHSKIHSVLSEKELRDHYHTIDRLRSHPEIARFIRWVARKPPPSRLCFTHISNHPLKSNT